MFGLGKLLTSFLFSDASNLEHFFGETTDVDFVVIHIDASAPAGLTSLLAGLLTPFLAWHTWLISSNMTTIEFCEQRVSTLHSYANS